MSEEEREPLGYTVLVGDTENSYATGDFLNAINQIVYYYMATRPA